MISGEEVVCHQGDIQRELTAKAQLPALLPTARGGSAFFPKNDLGGILEHSPQGRSRVGEIHKERETLCTDVG